MRIPALPSYGQGKHGGPTRRISLIHGENLTNVIITGKNGTIDGKNVENIIFVNIKENDGMVPMATDLTAFRQWDFLGLLVCDCPYF